ncbi:hypothetical protein BDZ90DRAFT_229105 [Jaminaea rosea]|uniref:Uncharacterized protein n=1 Tax=Jaminaea rosea TaxID=1569628 RepID=A0A316UYK7_9BASI|nr:hypothetical protein BDZ90DRAFT_229105 [Jaminaea rosea]PWN30074.1 hypothetical protein BDZ90DRAFT_229105 [Jaminaea rosea]
MSSQDESVAAQAQQTAASTAQKVADTADAAAGSAINAASDAAQGASEAAASAGSTVAAKAATALGSTAEQANHGVAAETDHSAVPKADEKDVPQRVLDHPQLGDAPKVAEGDEVRPVEPEIQDLGWSEDPHVPQPVIHGMTNEDVWVLVRRFNKQTFHIKAVDEEPHGQLDMNIADKDEFFPDKLRSTLERCYTTVGISMVALLTHVARLRSWKELRRTTLFAVIYLVAWIFNYLIPTFSALLLVLLISPRARRILFPPAPLAAISKKGTAQVPKAGHLGSADSATGAAESYKGEAVEQEASNLVNSISTVAVSTAIGKGAPSSTEPHPDDAAAAAAGDKSQAEAKQLEDAIPDPTNVATAGAQAKTKASGDKKLEVGDHTAAAVDQGVWAKLHPLLHALEDLCDTWERFANALSPTPPFHQHRPRLFLASALVLPLFLASLFITVDMVYKGTGFGVGFGFFGQPLFDRLKVSDVKQWLDTHYPNWPQMLELRNSILKGVPTNAQLTVTLMRIAEAAKSPLPPPPPAVAAPKPDAAQGHEMVGELPPEYQEEMKEAAAEGREDAQSGSLSHDDQDDDSSAKKKKKHGSKIIGFFKGTAFAGSATVLGANRAKASAGSSHSKNRVGVVKKHLQQEARGDGPSSFRGRYRGKRGYVDVITTAATPSLSFEPEWGAHAKAAQAALDAADSTASGRDVLERALEAARPKALFSIQVDSIREIRKIGGLGWKAKLVVGWAMDSEVADGIEITTDEGERFKMTAMPRRDEVFNRLASLGKQKWEIW